MRTSLHIVRGGPLLGLVALLAGTSIVHAGGTAPAAHRFEIHGSLAPAAAEKSAASAPFGIEGRLSAASQDAALQSGGAFVVMATLAESPLGCSGGDTIFTDGFDP
jgi:hypothetical protein